MTSDVDLDAIVLNGAKIVRGEYLNAYENLLGPPSRSEMPGDPPPYGHRNNVLHYYDALGVFLREHHATCLISGIEFLLEPEKCRFFRTTSHYSGALRVFGVAVHRGMEFANFASQCNVPFKPHLGHAWFVDGEHISIQFEVYPPKKKRSLEHSVITELCVGFRWAHRPENQPPAEKATE